MENELLAEIIIRLGHVSQSPVLEIDLLACELSVGQHEQLRNRTDFCHLQQACTTIGPGSHSCRECK